MTDSEFDIRFKAIQGQFVQRIRNDIIDLPHLFAKMQAAEDYAESRRDFTMRIHQYAGNGTTFGFAYISEAAIALETKCSSIADYAQFAEILPDVRGLFSSLIAALKKAVADHAQEGQVTEPAPAKAAATGRTVLIVDDDLLMMESLGHKLKRSGYKIITAKEGHEAVEMASRHKPSLILLDGMLPDMDGFSVLAKLKDTAVLRDIPVVMLTARRQDKNIKASMSMGAADYIVKPFKTDDLLARIRKILG